MLPPLRRVLGVGDRTLSGDGVALTFDDGPHAQGPPVCASGMENFYRRIQTFVFPPWSSALICTANC